MKEALQLITGWGYPLVSIVIIVVAATRQNLPGKGWLIAHLAVGLATMLTWRLPQLLSNIDSIDFDISKFYDLVQLPVSFIGIVGFCLLIPFVFAVANAHRSLAIAGEAGVIAGGQPREPLTGDTDNPLYGVHGWLKFFVVVNMYIAPVLFAIQQVLGFIGFSMLVDRYPGLLVVGLIEAGIGVFLVVKWIMIAIRLRDIVPGVVQEAKTWMLISLGLNILTTPLVFMSGMDPEDLLPGVIKGVLTGLVAFAIWYSYFSVSRRVKATYPDWDK